MPFIPRQVKPPARVTITSKLPQATADLLKRYAQFLDSTQEYVVNEVLCLTFRRDKEFQTWLATADPAASQAELAASAGSNAEPSESSAPRRR